MIWVQVLFSLTTLACLVNCDDMYNIPHDCLKNRAIAANYTPLGNIITIGNLPVYEYEPAENIARMLVGVYDIYGFAYENIKQVIDQMAAQHGGFRAVLPDFFRGQSANPAHNRTERTEWLQGVGDWETIVKPDLINIVSHYEKEGVTEFAIFGMCWGGRISTLTAAELGDKFKASGLVHPSQVSNEDAGNVTIPMYLMPSNGEPDMLPFFEVLQAKFGDNCGHRRFNQSHGFSGARGNFSDPDIQKDVNEVITTLGAFFDRNLNSSNNIQPTHLLIIIFIAFFLVILRH